MNPTGQRVIVVTGAAGGIGAATVRAFQAQGDRVFGVDREPDGLDRLRKKSADPDALALQTVDLADPDAGRTVIRGCRDAFGRIDALALVAGVGQVGHTSDVQVEEWDRVLNVNLRSAFLLSQAAMPTLVEHRGCIVAVSSVAGLQGWPYSAVYSASKFGLVGLMRSLAIEHGSDSVRVNVVAPGGVDTGMASSGWPADFDPSLKKRSAGLQGRRAEPEEIASVIVYLTSPAASFINGAVVPVDGGAFA